MKMRIAVFALALIAAPLAAQESWEERFDDGAVAEAADLLEDISLLNLIHGLHLSRGQMEEIRDLARDAEAQMRRAVEAHGREVERYRDDLARLREALTAGHEPPDEGLAESLQGQEARMNEIRREHFAALARLEARLRDVLSPGQAAVTEEFQPCLIPPRELRDPVRVGQPDDETADIENALDSMRWVPERAYETVRDAYVDLAVLGMERFLGPRPDGERARLRELADRARGMDDAEYAVCRPQLAREVMAPVTDLQESARELERFFHGAEGTLTKVGKYLLNPRVIPLLEARLTAPEAEVCPRQGEGPQAESCERCAGGDGAAPASVADLPEEPRFEELAACLGLEGVSAAGARDAIARGQVAMLGVLSRPRDDGRNILREFLAAAFERGEAPALRILGERLPGENRTYMTAIEEARQVMMRELAQVLTPTQARRLARSGIDLFKVKVGDLRPYDGS